MLVTAYPAAAAAAAAAADHSNSAVEAQASGSYPAAAAAADHSNSAVEAQASSSYPAAAGKQQILATVLWKRRLVAAIQQLYKLLYTKVVLKPNRIM